MSNPELPKRKYRLASDNPNMPPQKRSRIRIANSVSPGRDKSPTASGEPSNPSSTPVPKSSLVISEVLHECVWKALLRGSYYTSIQENKIQKIIELGSVAGGNLATELAFNVPDATVISIRNSPGANTRCPPNLTIYLDNAQEPWHSDYHGADCVFGRDLAFCFKSPRAVIEEAYNALNPGGSIELHDLLFPWKGLDETSDFNIWMQSVLKGAKNLGHDLQSASNYETWLKEVGFEAIKQEKVSIPVGAEAERNGSEQASFYLRIMILQDIASLSMHAQWPLSDAETRIELAKNDLDSSSFSAKVEKQVIYAQKPI